MDYLQILFTTLVTVFVSYITGILLLYGVLPSVSESYYHLPKKWNFLFTLFCLGFAIPTMIVGLDLTDNFLMFLAGGGICFVGVAAAYKETLTKEVHVGGALVGIISSQLSIAFDFKMFYVNIIFLVLAGLIKLLKIKNNTYWIELLAFISICYVLGINVL